MNLLDTFRFTADDGISGATTVTPIASGLRRNWAREGDTRSYRAKLVTKLKFRKEDYTYFRDIYDAGECNDVTLLIENYCGGAWVIWFEGIIPIYNGDYNKDRCTVEFEIKPNDVYECANKGFEIRNNWLDYATPTTILAGVDGAILETITCTFTDTFNPLVYPVDFLFYKGCWGTGTNTNDIPDPALAWSPLVHSQDYNFLTETYQLQTTWAREKKTSVLSPPGNGWINIGGITWVRPFTHQNSQYLRPPQWPPPDGFFHYIMSYNAAQLNAAPVSNGRKLSDVLIAVTAAMECDFDAIVSNFFNINPDATNPVNDVYDYAADNFANVFFFQKSDIVRASASNDATRFTFSMKEFLENLKNRQIFHSITNVAGVKTLRIEHYTYWDGANGIDLTTLDGGKYIVGKDDFKTDAEVPNFESFADQEAYRPAFTTKRITYPPACATTQGDERTATQLCTDFGGLVENPDAGLEGFFLLATFDIGGGQYLMNTLGGEANGAFAWTNCIPALWADGRFHPDATANVPGYVVNSVRKTKEQVQITIQFCCDDTFEPSELVNTQLGWGEVKSAEENTETATLKLSLLQ
jgi:hypothetical protein